MGASCLGSDCLVIRYRIQSCWKTACNIHNIPKSRGHSGSGYGLSQWASYQIRKIAGCACAGNAGNVFPRRRFQRKPLVSDPGMHHGTCVTHVPWCMSGSLTCDDGENVPSIPSACALAILRIWQEAHEKRPDLYVAPSAIGSAHAQNDTCQRHLIEYSNVNTHFSGACY